MVQTPWIFHGARTMELHSMGLHTDKINHGKSMEYWWHKRHGFSMVHAPWNFIPWGLHTDKKPMEILWWISMTYISWKWIPCGFYSGETYRNLTKNLWHINHDISIIDISRQLSFKGASTGQTHGNKMELFRTIQKFSNVMVSYNDETISTNIWNGLEKCSAAFIMEIT